MTPLSHVTYWKSRRIALILPTWAALLSAASAREITVQNESSAPVKITAAGIAAMPHQKVSVDDHGKTVTIEGVPLRLILEKAGVRFGDSLHGKRLASCLLVEAADGYRVVVALPELDPAFTSRLILLVDRADGYPLDSEEGPFRIVIPGSSAAPSGVVRTLARKGIWNKATICLIIRWLDFLRSDHQGALFGERQGRIGRPSWESTGLHTGMNGGTRSLQCRYIGSG